MSKIRAEVTLIHRQPREQDEDGNPQWRTIVKLTPLPGYGGGEINLTFNKSDVTFHPGAFLFGGSKHGDAEHSVVKQIIQPNDLITDAVCYVKGEKACTFKAHVPGFAVTPDQRAKGFSGPDVEERPAGVYEIDFTEVSPVATK